MKRHLWLSCLATAALSTTALLGGCGTSSDNQSASNTAASNNASTPQNSSDAANSTTSDSSTPANLYANLHPTTQQWSKAPAMQIDASKQYDALVHTNYGNFTIQLFAKDAPLTVNNFVFLAKHNFYHDDAFFRIIQSFMIQTGDPKNNGTGGPGYQFKDELPPKHAYGPGIVAMANSGPNSNGSQFFVCTGQDSTGLNQQPNYTVFGKVTSGMDVVQKLAAVPVVQGPTGEVSQPTKSAYIESVDISSH